MNLIHEAKSHNIPIFEQMILGFGAVGTWHTADDLSSVFWHSAFDTGACLQAPPVEVNRFASNSGLSGLAVNVHRLRAACLATLRLDFALPKVCVTIPDDDDDEDKNGNLQVVCEDGPSSACITTLEDSDDDNGSLDQPVFESSEPPAGGNLGHGDHASNGAAAGSQSSQPSQLDCQPASQSQVLSIRGAGRGRSRGRGKGGGRGEVLDRQALLSMPQHELARMYINQGKVLAKMRVTKRILTQEKQKLERKCKRLEREKAKLQDKENDKFKICKTGKQMDGRGARFSTSSWFSIGLRKCLSQVAATDFGLTTMTDVSGQTVMRREQKTGAALVNCFHLFMAEALEAVASCQEDSCCHKEFILYGLENQSRRQTSSARGAPAPALSDSAQVQPAQAGPTSLAPLPILQLVDYAASQVQQLGSAGAWSLLAVGFTNDATTSNIWRRKKLNILEVKVQWVKDFQALRQGHFAKAVATRRCTWLVFKHPSTCLGRRHRFEPPNRQSFLYPGSPF